MLTHKNEQATVPLKKRPRISSLTGFTFFEVMVTVAILAFGIMAVYQAFFVSLRTMNHLTYRLHANMLLDQKLFELQKTFRHSGEVPYGSIRRPDEVLVNNKVIKYFYTLNIRSVGALEDILQLDLRISWNEGRRRPVHLVRSTYILK